MSAKKHACERVPLSLNDLLVLVRHRENELGRLQARKATVAELNGATLELLTLMALLDKGEKAEVVRATGR